MPHAGWTRRIQWLFSTWQNRQDLPSNIVRGDKYLLARIRRGELGSRAPAKSTIKRLDNHGEAFLILDVVSALGSRIPNKERAALANLLLRAQQKGAWSYSSHTGIDIDTTACALRALDRLGKQLPLDGLPQFYNPGTGLYHTFHNPDFVDMELGLQFPPHTFRKHLGSHPCVLANVYLLLQERGQLSGLSPEFLHSVQKPDGNWASYYYPSPYYATRLFTELLTSLGPEYDNYMRPTLTCLLAAEPPSATQTAEVVIGLIALKNRFAADQDPIDSRITKLLSQINAAQLDDGSWPGDLIWESVMNDGAVEWAEDYYRVRSTALCLRALAGSGLPR